MSEACHLSSGLCPSGTHKPIVPHGFSRHIVRAVAELEDDDSWLGSLCTDLSEESEIQAEACFLFECDEFLSKNPCACVPSNESFRGCLIQKDISVLPTANDILSGRGSGSNSHPGNVRFIQMLKTRSEEYDSSLKGQKRRITGSIVQSLQKEGRRFLKFEESARGWTVMSDKNAVQKTASAMRDLIRCQQAGASKLRQPSTVPSTVWNQYCSSDRMPPISNSAFWTQAGLVRSIPWELEIRLPRPVSGFSWALCLVPVDRTTEIQVVCAGNGVKRQSDRENFQEERSNARRPKLMV
jgi:hypothetical protein